MPTKDFPLLGFQPDMAPDTPGLIVDSSQIVPTDRGFASTFDSQLLGSTFGASAPFGGIEITKIDGTARQFIGTSTKIHELVAGVATDRSGAVYNASATQPWAFAQMGDTTLAVNKGDVLQQSTTGAFSSVSGAPKASILVVAGPPNRAFAMLFDYNDGTNNYLDGIFWSPTLGWTPSIASQIGNVRLTDINGRFTAACAFRDGVVAFKAGAMYQGQYVGGSDQWAWQRISSTVGCLGPQALCVAGDVLYFADGFGLWQYDGSYPRSVPGAVHNWFAARFDNQVRLTWDAPRHLVWLRYTNDGFGNGLHAAYNVRSQKWAMFGGVGSAAHLLGPNYAAAFAGGVAQFQSTRAANNSLPARLRFNVFGMTYGMALFRSLRTECLVGPGPTDKGWLSGKLYYGPSMRTVTSTVGIYDTLSFAAPGRLDGTRSDRFIQPEITVAGGNLVELDRFSVDLVYVEDGE